MVYPYWCEKRKEIRKKDCLTKRYMLRTNIGKDILSYIVSKVV